MPEQAPMGTNRGLLQVATNADIERMEAAERDRLKAERAQNEPAVLSLASHIRGAWDHNKLGKVEVETCLLKCQRQRQGVYDPDLAVLMKKRGGTNIFMFITSIICRGAEAWLKDVLIPPGDKPWGIDPTPYPELSTSIEDQIETLVMAETAEVMAVSGSIDAVTVEQVRDRMQEMRDEILKEHMEVAKESAMRFETRIEDELREGGFYKALDKVINDLVTFPTAFMTGPILRNRKTPQWDFDEDGTAQIRVEDKVRREYERVSPFDLYPSKGAKNLQDGSLIHRLRMRRSQLQGLKGTPGYNSLAIDAVLWMYGNGGLRDWLWTDQERAELESKPQELTDPEPIIDGLLYWGSAQGRQLREWGMDEKRVPDLHKDYQICALLIGNFIVMAQLNPHPLGHRPYYGASYENVNDSIWGTALPEIIADKQRLCNAAARNLVNNMAIASGPQVEVHMDRLWPGQDVEDMYPWKIWRFKRDETGGRDAPAMTFYQPKSNSAELMKVYQYWYDQAREISGIPSYLQGSEGGGGLRGAGKTASGLSMLMNAATKTLKGVIFNFDGGIIRDAIWEHWLQLMLYDEDIEKTGDINIIARASEYLLLQEQLQVRLMEFMTFTNNPTDLAIMGLPGRAELLREAVRLMKIPRGDKVIPPEKVLLEALGQAQDDEEAMAAQGVQGAAQGGGRGGQARTTNLTPSGAPAGGQQTQRMPQTQ